MKLTNFLGRQMRHMQEGSKYISKFSQGATLIGVIGIYLEIPPNVVFPLMIFAMFVPWGIGIVSKRINMKSARMSAEYRDVEYFRTLERNIADIKEMIK